ncbi:hypothetical protein KNE206_65710 [Kitasatospora sp. NE20-6]|uniref:hypothetical protein n=1 Tax=Kitasatospora sp. NE20-6 TaxID=2859066 RepID=UPI0034DC1DC3
MAVARIVHGPLPMDFEQLAARIPAVQWGLALAGDADLELHLACTDRHELRAVTSALRRAGAARVQVELVLRHLGPVTATDPTATDSAVTDPTATDPAAAPARSTTP